MHLHIVINYSQYCTKYFLTVFEILHKKVLKYNLLFFQVSASLKKFDNEIHKNIDHC